ncbi:MAG: hypothetical protein ACXWKA_01295 [Xanthobacteraceae bacterium]
MQAVAVSVGERGELFDLRKFDGVCRLRLSVLLDCIQALTCSVALRRVSRSHGPIHRLQIVPNRMRQIAETGSSNLLIRRQIGVVKEVFHRNWINADTAALIDQVEVRSAWVASAMSRRLENAESGLDAVVCRQAFGDKRR